MTFHVGQKVVFVGGDFDVESSPLEYRLVEGAIYTVRDFDTRGLHLGHKWATVRLEEIIRSEERSCLGPWETGYIADCFRPLIERKTDTGMAMLKEILDRETVGDRTHVPKKAGVHG